jgi:hypothetical protein
MVQAVTGMVQPWRQGLQNNGGLKLQECPSFRKVSKILINQSHVDCTNSKTDLIIISMDLSIVIL